MCLLRGQRTVQRTVQLNETLPLTLPEALAAHARANAIQQLLQGKEEQQAADDSFKWWVERFRERAEIADWTAGHQFKVYLDQTASDIFWMIPESERDTLTKLFCPWGRVSGPRISKSCMVSNSTNLRDLHAQAHHWYWLT